MCGMWEGLMRKFTLTPHALATGLPALGMLLQGIRIVCDYCRDHHQIRDLADKQEETEM